MSLRQCEVFVVVRMYACLNEQSCPIDEYDVAEQFSDGDACERDNGVCPHESERNCDGAAEHWQECKESHPCSPSTHEPLRLFHTLVTHVQIALNPFCAAHSAYAVVYHRSEHVSYGAVCHERPRLQSCRKQCNHHCLAAEGEEAAGQKGCKKHTPITVVDEQLDQSVHM